MVFLDYYQVLEIPRNASDLEIRQGYRRQALKWHPDKNPNNQIEATRKFKEISEAFQVLGDWVKRRDHDYDLTKFKPDNHKEKYTRPATPHTARRSSTASSNGFSSDSSESGSAQSEQDSSSHSDHDSAHSDHDSAHSDPDSAHSDPDSAHSDHETTFSDSGPSFNKDFFSKSFKFPSSSDYGHSSHSKQSSKPSTYEFRNPYDVFEEFFGNKVFSKACPDPEQPFGFGMELNQNHNKYGNWPTPPEYIKNDVMRRKVVKKMTIVGLDGSKTELKTKTVTLRENGRETATISTGFENGILRTTSVKEASGGQITTFH